MQRLVSPTSRVVSPASPTHGVDSTNGDITNGEVGELYICSVSLLQNVLVFLRKFDPLPITFPFPPLSYQW